MSFPETRPTLIQRITAEGAECDWQEFLTTYWGPVCRFAWRAGRLSWQDAEDVASQTFVALLQNHLLVRWASNRWAKLRTLLCTVVRNVLSNRARVQSGRERLLRAHPEPGLDAAVAASSEQVDVFYAAWAEELLQHTAEGLVTAYNREGKGDHFRVLYGRLCDGMTMPAIAQALDITLGQAENAYRDARKRLTQQLMQAVREHIQHYCAKDEAEDEFVEEWAALGEYLAECGGLEGAVRRAYEGYSPQQEQRRASHIKATLSRIAQMLETAKPSEGLDNKQSATSDEMPP